MGATTSRPLLASAGPVAVNTKLVGLGVPSARPLREDIKGALALWAQGYPRPVRWAWGRGGADLWALL